MNTYFLSIALLLGCAVTLTAHATIVPTLSDAQKTHNAATVSTCIFCKIAEGNAPATIIAQNDDVIAFKSLSGGILIVPKKHITNLKSTSTDDTEILGELLRVAGSLGRQLTNPGSFQIAINEGSPAGQTVFHIHLHFNPVGTSLTTATPTI